MAYFITTPIYYVNSDPHLGHAYTTIAADVVARFHRMQGERTFFLTGTDEHGTKIAQAAEEAGVPVQEFVDGNSQRFRELLPPLDATPDFFIRTTDPEHKARVQEVWARIHANGHVYQGAYSGHYCTPCEAYYAEGDLLEGLLCPVHKIPTTVLEETNWFFRLSDFQDRLKAHFEQHPQWVRPRTRYNEALAFIEGGLEDFSISRSSITWGVPVPWDDSQVFYGWIDALFNYWSGLAYGPDGDVSAEFWPPKLQLLGKDILKFHAVIWPALLMAADLALPEELFIHGYLLQGGDKMSKTQGNVFDPFPVIEQHGADPLRFYVLREVQFGQDGSVSVEGFEQRYTSELANDLGNLVSRTAAMARKYLGDGGVPAAPADGDVARLAAETHDAWQAQMAATELSPALETTWKLVRALNRHVEERAPWKLAKDESLAELLRDTLGELVEGILAVAFALTPFMPETADRIRAVFGVAPLDTTDTVEGGATWSWGSAAGNAIGESPAMFPRLEPATPKA
jgi:methionyl-tRNA synthetase